MSGFSIDDVRPTLAKDFALLLDRIEENARDITVEVPPSFREGDTWAPFAVMGEAGHAIYGTSALVGAESLSSSARLLEELAEQGARALALATKHMARARTIAEGVAAGAMEMRAMLELELAHRGDEAEWHALTWQEQARSLLTSEEQPNVDGPHIAEVERDLETTFDFADRETLDELPLRPSGPSEPAFALAELPSIDTVQTELLSIFREEARQHLEALQAHLGALSAVPESLTEARAVERVFHTIKGAAATVGLLPLSEVAHSLQRKMEEVVDQGVPLTSELLRDVMQGAEQLVTTAGLAGHPSLSRHLGDDGIETPAARFDDDRITNFDSVFEEPVRSLETKRPAPVARTADRHAVDAELWQVFTLECSELLASLDSGVLSLEDEGDPWRRLQTLLPVFHTLKGVINTMGLATLGELLHRVEDFIAGLEHTLAPSSVRSIVTCLLEVQAEVRRGIGPSSEVGTRLSMAGLEARLSSILQEAALQPTTTKPFEPSREPGRNEYREDPTLDRKFARVPAERLDTLMDLTGELVVSRSRLLSRIHVLRTVQAELGHGAKRLVDRIEQFCDEHEFSRLDGHRAQSMRLASGGEGAWNSFSDLELDRYEDLQVLSRNLTELTSDFGECYKQLANGLSSLTDDSDGLGGIINGIQSQVTRARMVPVEHLFSRLRLPVRDAAVRECKEVRVVFRGDDVHVDKSIADALFQPLLHVVRNAVGHGIETPSVRETLGKAKAGIIELSARQELGQVVIEVKDDGGGLDLAKLKKRGVEMGLVADDMPLDDPSIKELVFAPGLSTESSAGAVSGRGLGCDVVRRAVERIHGTVVVKSDVTGTSFVFTVPISLTITKALLVRHGRQSFAIPLYFAERILDSEGLEIVESLGARRVRVDQALFPITDLGTSLHLERASSRGPLLMLRAGSERLTLQVDAIVGEEEVVIKSLGAMLAGHPLFAGVTIRGTGELVLILDVLGLVQQRASKQEPRRRALATENAQNVDGAKASAEVLPANDGQLEIRRTIDAPPVRRRVLFVDDSLSVRKVAEKLLGELGVHVTVAVDGVDALSKLRGATFDLVFTDLEMPRMHGFELLREARYLAGCQDLPIVVVTSRSGRKHQEQARDLGACDYLTKPFTSHALETAIARWSRRQADGAK